MVATASLIEKLDRWVVDRGHDSTNHKTYPSQEKRRKAMPYHTVGKENSGNIELYYEDHGRANRLF